MNGVLDFVKWYIIWGGLQPCNHFYDRKIILWRFVDISKRCRTMLNSCICYYFFYGVIFIAFSRSIVGVRNFVCRNIDYPTGTAENWHIFYPNFLKICVTGYIYEKLKRRNSRMCRCLFCFWKMCLIFFIIYLWNKNLPPNNLPVRLN